MKIFISMIFGLLCFLAVDASNNGTGNCFALPFERYAIGEIVEVTQIREGVFAAKLKEVEVLAGDPLPTNSIEIQFFRSAVDKYNYYSRFPATLNVEKWIDKHAIFRFYQDKDSKFWVTDFNGADLIPRGNNFFVCLEKEDEEYLVSVKELLKVKGCDEKNLEWQEYYRAFSENKKNPPQLRVLAAYNVLKFNSLRSKENLSFFAESLQKLRNEEDLEIKWRINTDIYLDLYLPEYKLSSERLQFLHNLLEKKNLNENEKRLIDNKIEEVVLKSSKKQN